MNRKEFDFIGEMEIPSNSMAGIHSYRAVQNFPDSTRFNLEWYKSIGIVKKACYLAYKEFVQSIHKEKLEEKIRFKLIDFPILEKMLKVCDEIIEGKHFEHFIVPAIQGGAGTSINMNINEIISNRSLQLLGFEIGDYSRVDPLEHANVYQSTNDVIPTALKVCIMRLLQKLESSINHLRKSIEQIEQIHRETLRMGYTQMQEAIPSSYGRLFSTYNDALSRDWWRVSKCFERIKIVNLGGGALGTGLAIPRFFIVNVIKQLQNLVQMPVTKGENLQDSTANLDSFVEVHAILKAHAVNIEKMVSDIRLLASDLVKQREIEIPQKQMGSSIMPGKINPVIIEFAVSVSHKIYSNDMLISSLCGAGCLDLNAYIPMIGHTLIESIELLIGVNASLEKNLFKELKINNPKSITDFFMFPSITTALVPYIGYNQSAMLAKEMKNSSSDIFTANKKLNLLDTNHLEKLLTVNNLLNTGFSIFDTINS